MGSLIIVAATTVKGTHSSKKANSSKMISEVPVNIFDNNCFIRAPRRIISERLNLVTVAARICRYMNSRVLGLTTSLVGARSGVHQIASKSPERILHCKSLKSVFKDEKHGKLRPPRIISMSSQCSNHD